MIMGSNFVGTNSKKLHNKNDITLFSEKINSYSIGHLLFCGLENNKIVEGSKSHN